jgi:hypothetical protein
MSPIAAARKRLNFDPNRFLATMGEGRKFVLFQKKQTLFPKGISLTRCFISTPAR